MALCITCSSIDLLNLPQLPASFNGYAAQNISPVLIDIRKRLPKQTSTDNAESNQDTGIPYHQSLDDLAAAAPDCAICKVVYQDVEQFRAEYPKAQEEQQIRARTKGPGWNMWLAQSQNNRNSGFMVVSHDADNKNVLWIVSAVGLSVHGNDPLSSVVTGRKIDADPLSDSTVQRAREWMQECDEHEKSRCTVTQSPLPAHVLDVGSTESGKVIRYASNGENGKYSALSHVRDVGPRIAVDERSENINLEELPQVFRDAITMTRKLGLQYLWIESLCSQVSHPDETFPSPKTSSIYANAYITLAATGSSSDTEGMLTPRTPPSYNSFPFTHDATQGTIHAASLPKQPILYFGNDQILRPQPLSQHGWALQDRIFSPRILHFGTSQLYFECNTHFVSEDGFEMTGRNETLNEAALSTSYTTATPWSSSFVAFFWHCVLDLYCRRSLPNPNDKLPALSSIAAHIASKSQDTYIAGLWRTTLLDDLIWQATGHAKGKTSDPPSYRAPSWSWASIDGPFGMFRREQGSGKGGYMEGVEWNDVATVLDYSVTLKGEDIYGEVADAWIKLRTPLERLEKCGEGVLSNQVWKMKTANGKAEGTVTIFDTKARVAEAETKELFAMLLVKHGKNGENVHYHGIVVAEAEGKKGTYKRYGKVVFDEETLGKCEWMGDEEKFVEVTIV